MNRRTATTLTEVLIAIFIMGIGLMAILSLFPLGAVQMAQALKDQRAAEAAGNASALARIIWKQACDADLNTGGNPNNPPFRESTSGRQYPRSIQRFVAAMDDPNFNDQSGTTPNSQSYPAPTPPIPPGGSPLPFPVTTPYYNMSPLPLSGPDADRSSYPVYVDMYGWNGNSTGNLANRKWWVAHPTGSFTALAQSTTAGPRVGLIPRRPLYIKNPNSIEWNVLGNPAGTGWSWNTTQRIYKQFSLLDDITYTADGVPADSNGRAASARYPVERQGRYSWSYMFRRVRNQSTRNQVDISVVVYSGRSLDVAGTETQYYGIGQTDSRFLTIAYNNPATQRPKPALKRGYWLLDATIFNNAGQPDPQGRFYRVVNVEEGPVTTAANAPVPAGLPTITVELQTPLTYGPNVRIINVLSNVVEVFQVGEVSQTSAPRNTTGDLDY